MKILLVEDDPFLQIGLADIVRDLGHCVQGPFLTKEPALDACRAEPPDRAILDYNLGEGEDSRSIADLLDHLGIPYAFATAYARRNLPERFQEARIISKPYRTVDILRFLSAEGPAD